jgi:hypothetical protein
MSPDEEIYRFYVGIFGGTLVAWSLQTVGEMLRAVLAKKQGQRKTANAASEEPTLEKQVKE